ncbi:MSMEG_0569 family flavin-dependent oxidoreductase [Phaeobacter gallaeciensis]|uniref:MSMEG_0569 family flavin-dependent oxidoreductase n=1 Tax=Phaeobacter gallaeciensis TaxID=60890 RepID=UPI00237FD252|nr:MSMEG_0569 family flavin-dependent oxidoreductase [Phaeobacter gallaeciensis]MDE4306244.1 MSMEG_0569 family flavin-dependent oxidoreductase [Phaeobacter gallaeciensis]MDE4310686.1 MSMEG_0569 family flavin-dependent oxidoreductase [Phaeobacter gallaeciensis]MDE4315131.1 MSMEG_0569 family flavin-dependent oxidoreductase [Phaeobacter gallaeciensis]MDE4319638.1 MSMEG_0569 family flavin-dependent oxidoreductase [Phaeobacter gallaeciensis]MDE4324042.1 MSMEG_0569 family flavin-dependent oxidoreduc
MKDTQIPHIPVVIVGGGQAGLSTAYCLKQKGIESIIFERHEKFHSWRNNRWDSFCLVTPNWQCRLPDFHYDREYGGTDPDGFMLKDEITAYVDAFAEMTQPNLREGVDVTRVVPRDGGFAVETSVGTWTCEQVVIATGGYDTPIEPAYAKNLSPEIFQMHSVDYRNVEQFPEGGVLIVGTGQSGVQLMEDFTRAGRDVHLAVGPAPRSPRKYRGRDATDWLYDAGHYNLTIAQHPDPHKALTQTNHYMSGRDGGKEIDLRKFHVDHGVELYGSLADMDGTSVKFLPDLTKNLDDADRSYVGIRNQIDAYIQWESIDAPVEPPFDKVWEPAEERTEIDLAEAGISSVLWAIGFRPDYSWIEADVFDARGKPVFDRGVTAQPGLHFIGLGWLNTWGSGRFLGIEEDSRYLADQIAAQIHTGVGQSEYA